MLEPAIARALAAGDQHIAITGASGWLGQATLDLLAQAFGPAFPARISCYGSARKTLRLDNGQEIQQFPLADLASLDARRVWLLHFAFLTKDRAEGMSEDAYRLANDVISKTVLDALDHIPVEAVFLASSGAAAKAEDATASPAMRLYGAMKLADEKHFADWAERSGRRAVIGRVFNITGPHINKHQAYAIANFILDGLAGNPIQVRAPREVFRGYVAIRELMSLVFAMLGDANLRVARFDSGGEALELGAVAQAVTRTLRGGPVERAEITEAMADHYVGDDRAYAELRKHYGIHSIGLDDQILETAGYLKRIAA